LRVDTQDFAGHFFITIREDFDPQKLKRQPAWVGVFAGADYRAGGSR
jgi:hypothetical protein